MIVNELQRQAYLSALGIENYVPRWCLPNAPGSVACSSLDISDISFSDDFETPAASSIVDSILATSAPTSPQIHSTSAIEKIGLIDALADVQKKTSVPINAASILRQLEDHKASVVSPFTLSLWRPVPGFLIIDSRNASMALPTELLLSNILRSVPGIGKADLREDVLRWPMIENRFVSRTDSDARTELQTWLAVENELRPINRLWLMGENASQYFVPADLSVLDCRWQHVLLSGTTGLNSISALLLPSLIELLQKPIDKARLWAALS